MTSMLFNPGKWFLWRFQLELVQWREQTIGFTVIGGMLAAPSWRIFFVPWLYCG